ncbi:hypothetical protein MG293_010261 [Ovis ammon polii]|uniref:Uncharacterized protein n=1 Tax=Ovis ammon polii TaxID=230172 RepID=A0AAD4U7F6_OVIAM|nr:hypothetical protein MG293_010261 [Ovis ammon polii]
MRTQGWGWGGGVSHDAAQVHFTSTARLFSRMTTCLCFHLWCSGVSVSPCSPPSDFHSHLPPAPGVVRCVKKEAFDSSGSSGHWVRFSEPPFSAAVGTCS